MNTIGAVDFFGVPAKVGTPIVYFRGTASSGYYPRLGYVQERVGEQLIVQSHTGKADKIRTPMFVVPEFEDYPQGDQIGEDCFGTPVCVGDHILTSYPFQFIKRYSLYPRHAIVRTEITTGYGVGKEIFRLTRDNNTQPLSIAHYKGLDLFVSEQQTPEATVRHHNQYHSDATKIVVRLDKGFVLKNSPKLIQLLIKSRLAR